MTDLPICGATTRMTLSPFQPEHPDVVCHRHLAADGGRHVGEHQGINHQPAIPDDPAAEFEFMRRGRPAYDSLVTWDEGGARAHAYDPAEPYRNCMCVRAAETGDARQLARLGHRPEDHRWSSCYSCGITHDTTAPVGAEARCSSCGIWWDRVATYAAGPVTTGRNRGGRHLRFHGDAFAHGEPRLYGWAPGSSGAFGGRVVTVTCDDGTILGPADSLWDNGRIPWWLLNHFPPNATLETGEKVARPGRTTGFCGHGTPLTYTGHP